MHSQEYRIMKPSTERQEHSTPWVKCVQVFSSVIMIIFNKSHQSNLAIKIDLYQSDAIQLYITINIQSIKYKNRDSHIKIYIYHNVIVNKLRKALPFTITPHYTHHSNGHTAIFMLKPWNPISHTLKTSQDRSHGFLDYESLCIRMTNT